MTDLNSAWDADDEVTAPTIPETLEMIELLCTSPKVRALHIATTASVMAGLPALKDALSATPADLPASPAPAVDGWRSMDSAPKDGTRIDVWLGDDEFPMRRTDVYWGRPHHVCGEAGSYCDSCPPDRDMWCDDLSYGEPEDLNPTHWRPPPAAPSSSPVTQAVQGEALTEARAALERDRTAVAGAVSGIRSLIASYSWLRDGSRGSYAYDDDRYVEEFGHALTAIETVVDRLARIARDWSNCPQTKAEVDAALATPQAGEGREALIKATETLLQTPDLADVPDEDKDPETVDAERQLRAALAAARTQEPAR